MFPQAPLLSGLFLAQCALSAPEVAVVCDALAASKRQGVSLDLSGNDVGDAGAACLAQLDMHQMQSLHLRGCGISNVGRIAVGEALRARPPPSARGLLLHGVSLALAWKALGLPPCLHPLNNSTILAYWADRADRRMAFVMCCHARLGSASLWSGLDVGEMVGVVLGTWSEPWGNEG